VAQSVQLLILKYSPENEFESAVCDAPQAKTDILECSLWRVHHPRLYFARVKQRCGPIFEIVERSSELAFRKPV
jgi:hypothetical protein